jgi:hypothetical protein
MRLFMFMLEELSSSKVIAVLTAFFANRFSKIRASPVRRRLKRFVFTRRPCSPHQRFMRAPLSSSEMRLRRSGELCAGLR